jgi:apolipoprotein N-acyltransferase
MSLGAAERFRVPAGEFRGNGDPRQAPTPRALAWRRRGVAALSGALLASAFPVVDWNPLAWIALVPLLWVALGRGVGAAFRTAWIGGLVFFVATLYWLVLTIGTYTNLSPLVSVGPVLLLCGFLGLWFAVFAAGCEAARRRGIELWWMAPALWVVLEWVRNYLLGGFPWVSLGYSQHRTTYLIQFIEFTGIYGVSALVVLVNVVVYSAFRRWRDGGVPGTRALLALTTLLMMLVSWGFWRVHRLESTPSVGSLRVGFIQGNVAQDEKWEPTYQDATIDRYDELTRQAAAAGAELVVWPETAAPFFFQDDTPLRDRVLDIARRLHVWVLVGSPAYDFAPPAPVTAPAAPPDAPVRSDELILHNRVYLVGPDGEIAGRYDKMKLVPFGEYIPLASVFFFVHKIVEGVGDFQAGTDPVVFRAGRARFGALICYEGIFPGLTRRFVAGGADFLVNITNDAWFGRTSAPYQHLAMVAVRAIENRTPIVRVANTGFSAMVDGAGRVRWRTGLFDTEWRVDTVEWTGDRTLYTRAGDLFVYLCMILLAASMLVGMTRPVKPAMDRRQAR